MTENNMFDQRYECLRMTKSVFTLFGILKLNIFPNTICISLILYLVIGSFGFLFVNIRDINKATTSLYMIAGLLIPLGSYLLFLAKTKSLHQVFNELDDIVAKREHTIFTY